MNAELYKKFCWKSGKKLPEGPVIDIKSFAMKSCFGKYTTSAVSCSAHTASLMIKKLVTRAKENSDEKFEFRTKFQETLHNVFWLIFLKTNQSSFKTKLYNSNIFLKSKNLEKFISKLINEFMISASKINDKLLI